MGKKMIAKRNMGKKMRETDKHKRENNQVEESNAVTKETDLLDASAGNKKDDSKLSNRDHDKNKRKADSCEKKKDQMKRKSEFDADKKDSQKALKKHKKSKDGVCEVKEASNQICTAGKENREQESSKAMYLEKDLESEAKRVRKDKQKQETVEVQKSCSTEDIDSMLHGEEGEYEKRKQKKKKHKLEKPTANDDGHIPVMSRTTDGSEIDKEKERQDENAIKKVEDSRNGKKRKKKSSNYGLGADKPRKMSTAIDNCEFFYSNGDATECRKSGVAVDNDEDGNRNKTTKKKSKSLKTGSDGKEISKKVSFSDNVEVFPCADNIVDANMGGKEGLVYGKRYSKEEDGIIMDAVANYIESHNLGEEGLDMVLNCKAYSQVKNCWKEIQTAIPWRPYVSVYHRAHVLFERDEKRPWTAEECELIQKFVQKHGPKWKLLGAALGKHRLHVKDTWRRIKLTNTKKGHWSQDEYQNLFDLVNLDLSMKAFEERKSKHGMLRDNICWSAISDKMETRGFAHCCHKWYDSLASPMVAEGKWADADDYRMLDALSSMDACCMEDVDWDNLIEHRSGDLCRKRWNQMVQHIGPHGVKSFAEQVEVLAKRYRPEMVEAREAYDSKSPVDLP